MSGATPARFFWPAAIVLLTCMALLMATSATKESPTYDEPTHLAAGYSYLKTGDFRLNVEHPPLVKMLAALPLLLLGAGFPLDSPGWTLPAEDRMGADFLFANRLPADTLLLAGRSAVMLLTLLFGLALALWTRRWFGAAAALIALGFYCFDPNMIAHGRYVTTDAAVTALFFLTCACWTAYLLSGARRDLLLAAVCFSLAQVTKFSALLLIPALALLYLIRWIQVPKEFPLRRAAAALVTVAATWVAIVALIYLPETLRGFDRDTLRLAQRVNRASPAGEALYRIGQRLNFPAHPYVVGWAEVAAHNHAGHDAYLLGAHSEQGWWYYFPVAFLVKSAVATVLAALTILVFATKRMRAPFLWIAIAAPPLLYFVAAMWSGINLGIRHLLPVYPFLYVAAAAILAHLPWKPLGLALALGLVGLQAVESVAVYPNYLAFFNFAVGGPGAGPRYLLDSNIDWGQDGKKLAEFFQRRGSPTVRLNYFGSANLSYYGLKWRTVPVETKDWENLDEFAAVSVTELYGAYGGNYFEWLRRQTPVAKVGYSIYVYDLRKRKQ